MVETTGCYSKCVGNALNSLLRSSLSTRFNGFCVAAYEFIRGRGSNGKYAVTISTGIDTGSFNNS